MTCSLPMNADDTDLVVAHTSSGAEELKAPKAGVVSAFGTVPINDAGFDPIDAGPLRIARYIEPFTMLVGQL
ncbi:MAG TPA: hypothetical protein VKQ05_11115, partial [Gemmatimonadales bacterium]|nr:hypothetical protein [Gemmatimonadales bacterium]